MRSPDEPPCTQPISLSGPRPFPSRDYILGDARMASVAAAKEAKTMSSEPNRRMKIGDFLLRRLKEAGVRHLFGVPGDDNLELLHQLHDTGALKWIGTCSELNASADSSADWYSSRTGRSRSRRRSPAAVGATDRVVRSTSRTPRRSSRLRTIALTRGGDKASCLAALVKLFSSTTATKAVVSARLGACIEIGRAHV